MRERDTYRPPEALSELKAKILLPRTQVVVGTSTTHRRLAHAYGIFSEEMGGNRIDAQKYFENVVVALFSPDPRSITDFNEFNQFPIERLVTKAIIHALKPIPRGRIGRTDEGSFMAINPWIIAQDLPVNDKKKEYRFYKTAMQETVFHEFTHVWQIMTNGPALDKLNRDNLLTMRIISILVLQVPLWLKLPDDVSTPVVNTLILGMLGGLSHMMLLQRKITQMELEARNAAKGMMKKYRGLNIFDYET